MLRDVPLGVRIRAGQVLKTCSSQLVMGFVFYMPTDRVSQPELLQGSGNLDMSGFSCHDPTHSGGAHWRLQLVGFSRAKAEAGHARMGVQEVTCGLDRKSPENSLFSVQG